MISGMSLDLWRGIALRRDLHTMAVAASIAGADGLDPQSLRDGGAALDPALARRLAYENLAGHSNASDIDDATVDVDANTVTVRLRGHITLSLLGIFAGNKRVDVAVSAHAQPRREP